MTDTTTPTGDADQDSSGIGNEPLLDTNSENTTAVEETTNDTDESSNTESASDETSSTAEESSDDNSEDISAFAKSQGYDPEQLTDNERKLLTQLRKNSVEKRRQIDQEANRKLNDEVQSAAPAAADDDRVAKIERNQAIQDEKIRRQDYFMQNPEDQAYEGKMAEIVAEEREKFGDAAAWQLLQNLPRLVREAKFASGVYDSDAARESGRREERENLRHAQEAGADASHASTPTSTNSQKVDRDWIENVYDPSNPEHQKMLDDAMVRGTIY